MHSPAIIDMHNTRSGRIFILGNGPSLIEQRDLLTRLKDEATFCCNSFPKWEPMPFLPTYYGITDMHSSGGISKKYNMVDAYSWPDLDMMKFQVGWPDDVHHPAFIWVDKDPTKKIVNDTGPVGFGEDLPPLPTARTTPFTLAQIALWMGYRHIYMLGIEQTRGYAHDPDAKMSTTGRHEFPLDKNPKYQIAIQRAAERIRADLEANGGKIYDCTPEGLLNATGQHFKRRGMAWRDILEYQSLAEVLDGASAHVQRV
jgi:hypothetical protein